MRRRGVAWIVITIISIPAFAQRKEVTLDAAFNPETRVYFGGQVHEDFKWVDDNTLLWPARNEKRELVEWRVFDLKTQKSRPLFALAQFRQALEDEGVSPRTAAASGEDDFDYNPRANLVLVRAGRDLFLYSPQDNIATRLTYSSDPEEVVTFSPDGANAAFVAANNLYRAEIRTRAIQRLTVDGSAELLNGRTDWLYEEEIFGRGNKRGYWWSPDGKNIVYLQLDESRVPEYVVSDDLPYRPALNEYHYPKPGDPNPRARLFVRPNASAVVPIRFDRYNTPESDDNLIVNVGWTGDSKAVTYQVQNRQQTWLDLNLANPGTGETRHILRDSTKAWIDPIANPIWLKDGSFLWQSERSGWRHIYHYKRDGTLIRQVTSGNWEVREVHGYDEKTRYIYFSGTERSHLGLDVYRIRIDGRGLQRLSQEPGTHVAAFNPSLTAFVDSWSDIRTPKQMRVFRSDGKPVAVVEENRVPGVAEYAIADPQFFQVTTRDGFPMEAMMLRPPDFDPSKRYPVFYTLYGGPHAQRVLNKWHGDTMLFNQVVANQGVIVFLCDNRTASGKGAASTWPIWKEFGRSELADIEDAVAWLRQQPYVDRSRIMLNGWSYGGFMVAYALTHSKSFIGGVAGAPVIDWRDYDTVYTERHLLTPEENPDGYRNSSPRFFAKDLSGRLLLIHGQADDNVHVQNTTQFSYELQKAGKPFELMLYPTQKHTFTDKALDYHRQALILDFVRRTLK
jgi:dipeptidyl-peptidase-4